jgi:hypothetical protein
MAEITNRRNLIRRSDTASVVPTINSSTTYVTNDWAETDIMVGEWFMNSYDSRLWVRDLNGLHEIIYTGSTDTFVSLNDTPNAYTSAGDILVINSANTALEFAAYPTDTNSIVNMTDFFPGEINTGYTGYSIVVDATGSGFTYELINPTTFLTLSDTPSGYIGYPEYLLRVHKDMDKVEFVDGKTLYMDLTTIQTIEGKKTFTDETTFGTIGMSNLYFSGVTDVNITDISTDTGFTIVNDTSLATTAAIFGYVNTLVYGSGATDGIVLVSTDQTITGEKTFSTDANFTNVNINDDLNLELTSYHYFGQEDVDNSWRIFINPLNELEIQKRESGVWVYKGNF